MAWLVVAARWLMSWRRSSLADVGYVGGRRKGNDVMGHQAI
jgi:hypothetical protein